MVISCDSRKRKGVVRRIEGTNNPDGSFTGRNSRYQRNSPLLKKAKATDILPRSLFYLKRSIIICAVDCLCATLWESKKPLSFLIPEQNQLLSMPDQ